MIYGLWLSSAGAKSQGYRQEIVSNNIANADTTGFRKQFAVLRARPDHLTEFGYPPPALLSDPRRLEGGLHMYETPSDFKDVGPIKPTGRNADFAIRGDGFFQVRRGNSTFLTRNGAFAPDNQGRLTVSGSPDTLLLSSGGAPIQVDPNQPFDVRANGEVFQNNAPLGRIGLFSPSEPDTMRRAGDGLFEYAGPMTAGTGQIDQNYLEGSNVEPITQMVDLIEISRAFEMNIRMVQMQSDGLSTLLQTVPRLV